MFMTEIQKKLANDFWLNVEIALAELKGSSGHEFSNRWLAVNCGISPSLIYNDLRRHIIPKVETVRKMAEVLGVSEEFLRSGVTTKPREIDSEIAYQVALLPHFKELAEQLLKMDAAEILYHVEYMRFRKSLNGHN